MRPGQIKVFDGLRITTEHMDHLQGSFHSAIQDLREILGLGRVYYGFEVISEDDQSITAMPGLAFDFQGNRIISDEPKTVDINLIEEGDKEYVCIKYERIEKGKVEEKPTLIWDSCSVLLRDSLPESEENLIPIAEFVKAENGDKQFEIVSLLDTEQDNVAETVGNADGTETVDEERERDIEAVKESEQMEKVVLSRPGVQQGVVRLSPYPENTGNLKDIILKPLRSLLLNSENSSKSELLLILVEKEITLDFQIISLSCNTIISATFASIKDEASFEDDTAEKEILLPENVKFQSTARGEVTFSDHEVSQFGVSTIQCYSDGKSSIPCQISDLNERGIAQLFFDGIRTTGNEIPTDIIDIIGHLQLLVEVKGMNKKGFKITCKLLWKGGLNQEIITKIETKKLFLKWEGLVAWKATGDRRMET